MKIKDMKQVYMIGGSVIGRTWDGGLGAYPSETITGTDKDALIARAKEMLTSGALDSGFGFERLTSATLVITTITTFTYNEKEFINKEYEQIFIQNP